MSSIGIVLRPGVGKAKKVCEELIAWVVSKGHTLLVDANAGACKGAPKKILAHDELVRAAEVIVTLGGDGTLIGLARHLKNTCPTVLGVNFGNLGFLTETTPVELFEALERTLAGKSKIAERRMLKTIVLRKGSACFESQALNDVVIQKEARSRLMDIDLGVNGQEVMRLRADGLIVATATGSTAYSLAAGGSIVHPGLHVMLVTPICAHSLTARPLVLDLTNKLSAKIPEYDGAAVLTVDGQTSVPLESGDEVQVEESPHRIRLVRSHSRSYFDILRTKLNWGIANKAE